MECAPTAWRAQGSAPVVLDSLDQTAPSACEDILDRPACSAQAVLPPKVGYAVAMESATTASLAMAHASVRWATVVSPVSGNVLSTSWVINAVHTEHVSAILVAGVTPTTSHSMRYLERAVAARRVSGVRSACLFATSAVAVVAFACVATERAAAGMATGGPRAHRCVLGALEHRARTTGAVMLPPASAHAAQVTRRDISSATIVPLVILGLPRHSAMCRVQENRRQALCAAGGGCAGTVSAPGVARCRLMFKEHLLFARSLFAGLRAMSPVFHSAWGAMHATLAIGVRRAPTNASTE